MDKAPDAYRTISEVGEDLDIAQHVLRFWETRFPQIKPLKRGGGRRYYRPDDVELLKGIRHLLYREGYTIKGVQRILREQGPRGVQAVGRLGNLAALGGAALSPQDVPAERETRASGAPVAAPVAFSQAPIRSGIEQAAIWLARGGQGPLPEHAAPDIDAEEGQVDQSGPYMPAVAPASVSTPEPMQGRMAQPSLQSGTQLSSPPSTAADAASMPERAVASNPGQVAMYRGGLQRIEAQAAGVDSFATQRVVSSAESIDRRARLRFALGELEACQSVIAQALGRGR